METFFVEKKERKDNHAKTHKYEKQSNKKVNRQKIAEIPKTC